MEKIKFEHVSYSYDHETNAIDDVSFEIEEGSYTAIIGHNGSGKSTIAKLMIDLLERDKGNIYIDKMELCDETLFAIRDKIGIVFQNPDNQFIGATVADDIAFGLENHQVESERMQEIIDRFAAKVNMTKYMQSEPTKLSGGQKQRVAIAGVVAMHPKCIVLDEPTAMLDPTGRKEVIRTVRALNQVEDVTVLLITHYMEEVIYADKVLVMDEGKVVMQGTPREIFSQVEKLQKYRLDVPQVTLLAHELKKAGLPVPDGVLTVDELVEELCRCK